MMGSRSSPAYHGRLYLQPAGDLGGLLHGVDDVRGHVQQALVGHLLGFFRSEYILILPLSRRRSSRKGVAACSPAQPAWG